MSSKKVTEQDSQTKPDLPAFQRMQLEFTAHIRDPNTHPGPQGIEDRRMAIYRELFFNNVKGFIDNGFPVLRSHYDDPNWEKLVRAFFSSHHSDSPYFVDISKEFVLYLQAEHRITQKDPPYLFELAHFEWAEVALMVDQEEPDWAAIDPHGDFLEQVPVVSPTAYCLAYQWPVNEISPQYQPLEKPDEPRFILIYRDTDDDVVYRTADPVTARIMELLLEQSGRTGRALLLQLAEEMQHPDPEKAVHTGYSILLKLLKAGVLLGVSATGKK